MIVVGLMQCRCCPGVHIKENTTNTIHVTKAMYNKSLPEMANVDANVDADENVCSVSV